MECYKCMHLLYKTHIICKRGSHIHIQPVLPAHFQNAGLERNNFLFLLSFRLLSEFTFGWKDGGKKEEELWPVFCTFVQLQQQVLIQKGKKGTKIWRNKTQWFIYRFKIKVIIQAISNIWVFLVTVCQRGLNPWPPWSYQTKGKMSRILPTELLGHS